MGAKTNIEWTDATWNPTVGCTSVSAGCDHCYARALTERFSGPGSFDTMVLHPERLELPLRWRKPRRVFVNSMSDLFHDAVSDDFIARVFAVMAAAPRHTFQVLTKRHARMRALLSDPLWWNYVTAFTAAKTGTPLDYTAPLPNVWLGVSVENQQWADIRIPALLKTSAAVRFLSCEPLLGPIDLTDAFTTPIWNGAEVVGRANRYAMAIPHIGWVIAGGESGKNARPMHPQWARDIRDQCVSAGVAFLFKQWGEWAPTSTSDLAGSYGSVVITDPTDVDTGVMRWVGKQKAGRELDGRIWDEYPVGAH